uniref:F-box domain-containing protein n=1 Tax=Tanacetum cinerariifolium TaxID=118510 RepID=A0A6L2LV15_TANCI|nr:hypothetical protein [Tanacetum cinerariifolium]
MMASDLSKLLLQLEVVVDDDDDDDIIDYYIRIQIYSSESGLWSVLDDQFPYEWFDDFSNGIYWNGAIHWLNTDQPFHVKLDIVDHPRGYNVWSVKYFVNLDDILRPYPTWRIPTNWSCHDIFSIVLGQQDEDSFMVIELSGKILQHKFVLDTVNELFDLGKRIVTASSTLHLSIICERQ